MSLLLLLSVLSSTAIGLVVAVPQPYSPTVRLDNGTFVGAATPLTHRFFGIPFAKAPIGDLRFNLPVAVNAYTGTYNAQDYGPACPQQGLDPTEIPDVAVIPLAPVLAGVLQIVTPAAEDCLSVNVVAPAGIKPHARLPVVVWIYGGGFEFGGSSLPLYNGDNIVQRSIALRQPVIYVSLNYRLSAFGFLAGKEVKEAGIGNLGLQDQRLALRWVQKYISAFGGDPTKVIIWGESAGALSVALHMLANGGSTEGLFRGAFMQSGAPLPVRDITHGQQYYDQIVKETNCSSSADPLQCLRELPFDVLKTAVDHTPNLLAYQSLHVEYLPLVDGVFVEDNPTTLVSKGRIANVPFVTGSCDDEGTIFSFVNLNVTTDAELRTYLSENYFGGSNSPKLDEVLQAYPADPAQGSPFDTGLLNIIGPQYKRMAAIQGDLIFQGPRRLFLQERADKQPAWAYLSKRNKTLPGIGSAHTTDVDNIFGGGDLTDFLVNFAHKLDPNGKHTSALKWPRYTNASPKLMTLFDDDLARQGITEDNYRAKGMELLVKLLRQNPL